MSDQFDELIKGKIESKQYAYSAKAWRSYVHHAGIAKLAVAKWIAIAVSSVAVLSTGGYFIYQHVQNQNTMETVTSTVPQIEPTAEMFMTDSLSQNEEKNNLQESATIESDPIVIAPKNEHQTVFAKTVPAKDTIAKAPEKKEIILRPRSNRRILEINPDTIPTNY